MYEDTHCLACDATFNYDELDEPCCPECGSRNIEDWAACVCTQCEYVTDSNPGDGCPECGGDLEEVY